MNLLRTAIGMAAMVASLALPPLASADSVVPPGNSAATQYTETFPTTGGNAEVNSGIGAGGGGGRSPAKVLGPRTAHKLEDFGQEGSAVAALAAEAAPTVAPSESSGGNSGNGGGNSGGHKSASPNPKDATIGTGGAVNPSPALDASNGSSGFGEVLSQATGSSSGEIGILLPLVLLLTLFGAIAYAWRQQQPGKAAP